MKKILVVVFLLIVSVIYAVPVNLLSPADDNLQPNSAVVDKDAVLESNVDVSPEIPIVLDLINQVLGNLKTTDETKSTKTTNQHLINFLNVNNQKFNFVKKEDSVVNLNNKTKDRAIIQAKIQAKAFVSPEYTVCNSVRQPVKDINFVREAPDIKSLCKRFGGKTQTKNHIDPGIYTLVLKLELNSQDTVISN